MPDLNKLFDTGTLRMLGTESTGLYSVRAASTRGRVGVRHLSGGTVRIRLEPTNKVTDKMLQEWRETLGRDIGYKQPRDDGENRFSIVVSAGDHADEILKLIFGLLGEAKLSSFAFNPDVPEPGSTSNALAA
jgi:hypothetical protein